MTKLGPFKFGNATAELVPHFVPGIGARLFLILDNGQQETVKNLTADDARALADYLKIAACQAESIEKNKTKRAPRAHTVLA